MQPEKQILLRTLCVKNGLFPTDIQLGQIDRYVELLLDWNHKINLISRKDEENLLTNHILHCISPLFKVEIPQKSTVIDIGTGGGLPGIPIKIMRPDLLMYCLDSIGKKAKAVSRIINDLGLERIDAIWGRAEEIGRKPEFFEKSDFVLARAVAPLTDLVLWSKNFLKKAVQEESTGLSFHKKRINLRPPALLAFKGGELAQEIETAKRKQPHLNIEEVNLAFHGSEHLMAAEKKILIVRI